MLNRIPKSLLLTLISLSVISAGHALCSKDKFQCDTTKCVPILLRCDGHINCHDLSDEMHCDLKEPNLTITTNSTSSTIIPSNLTTSPPTPPTNHNENTKPVLPKKRKEDKYTKDKKNRIYFDNNTKRKKKRQFYNKSSARTPIQSSITATDKTTSSEVQRKNIEAGGVTHCSVEECMKWKACWRDINSHECPCDEAACRRGLKTSAYVGNENKRKTKDVLEWVIISVSSTCLIVAIIVLLLKRRKLRHTNATPLHVRTVVCYHHGHEESACLGQNVVIRGQEKGASENRPLCEKTGCPSLVTEDEENVCYIDFAGQPKRNIWLREKS